MIFNEILNDKKIPVPVCKYIQSRNLFISMYSVMNDNGRCNQRFIKRNHRMVDILGGFFILIPVCI